MKSNRAFIYSLAIHVTVTSECHVKKVVCKKKNDTLANRAEPDQTLQNAASDQGLHCYLKYRKVRVNETVTACLKSQVNNYQVSKPISYHNRTDIFCISARYR